MDLQPDGGSYINVPALLYALVIDWLLHNDPDNREEYWIQDGQMVRGRRISDDYAFFASTQFKVRLEDQNWMFN